MRYFQQGHSHTCSILTLRVQCLEPSLSGNKTDVFLSLPALTPVGHIVLNATNFSPVRGVFTPNGNYYLEASGASNVVDVISMSNFQLVNTLSLPASSSPGLSDMTLTPDSNYAYVVMHGTPTTGGIIYLIPLANIATLQLLRIILWKHRTHDRACNRYPNFYSIRNLSCGQCDVATSNGVTLLIIV